MAVRYDPHWSIDMKDGILDIIYRLSMAGETIDNVSHGDMVLNDLIQSRDNLDSLIDRLKKGDGYLAGPKQIN